MIAAELFRASKVRMEQVEANGDEAEASREIKRFDTSRGRSDDNPLTFSFSPENESPQSGGDLKLVPVSSHVPDGAGEDHAFGVHLLQERNASTWLTWETLLHL